MPTRQVSNTLNMKNLFKTNWTSHVFIIQTHTTHIEYNKNVKFTGTFKATITKQSIFIDFITSLAHANLVFCLSFAIRMGYGRATSCCEKYNACFGTCNNHLPLGWWKPTELILTKIVLLWSCQKICHAGYNRTFSTILFKAMQKSQILLLTRWSASFFYLY